MVVIAFELFLPAKRIAAPVSHQNPVLFSEFSGPFFKHHFENKSCRPDGHKEYFGHLFFEKIQKITIFRTHLLLLF